ncbi:Protein of unknown function [Pyronema omphalodes CBS 100304]|uniref:Uncharacterized protein n=1 Tax=Pyronema omphalodes (strain CBS 100304) TaxID=1076935 RepID=U4LHZ2_PYROM|nr:Protein of unknown function [Pyronema omphalodes CBS 100304]
MYSSVPKIPA